ncbi:LacI family transcriptional regulator [Paenibacillus sp. TRM 82003]|nr:LacI family transcriptional regulator [Paenibacillus sp. TRM 82003]
MVTIYDIAKAAGVSAMTVSRVINNTGRISEATRAKVKQVMEDLNYVPNSNARSLVKQETKMLSLLITDITNPFYTTLARGAEDTAKAHGYKLLFGNSDENYEKEKDYVDMILSTRVDGVLFAPAGDRSEPHLRMFERHRIPYVLLDREVPGIEADQVLGDSRDGARRLVEHLLGLGHSRVAMVNGRLDVSTARLRHSGYLEALKLNDIPYDPELVASDSYTSTDVGAIVARLLALDEPPTAIFAANNFLALSVIRSLRSQRVQVPSDVSVVCFDDLGAELMLDPFLTVSRQPAYEFGALGMRLLVERIQGAAEREPRRFVLPSELVIRRSATVVPSGTPKTGGR